MNISYTEDLKKNLKEKILSLRGSKILPKQMQNIYYLRDHFYHYSDSIERKELLKFRLPNINLTKAIKFQFQITQTSAEILLSESFIKLKWKITKRNGTSIGKENVTEVCGLNPFKSKKVTKGKTKIEHVDSLLDIIQHVKKLIEYTPEYLTLHTTGTYWYVYLDSNDIVDRKKFIIQGDGTINSQTPITDIANKLNVIENENYNEDFDKRCKLTEDSTTNTSIIQLDQMFDFTEAYPKIFTGFENNNWIWNK